VFISNQCKVRNKHDIEINTKTFFFFNMGDFPYANIPYATPLSQYISKRLCRNNKNSSFSVYFNNKKTLLFEQKQWLGYTKIGYGYLNHYFVRIFHFSSFFLFIINKRHSFHCGNIIYCLNQIM